MVNLLSFGIVFSLVVLFHHLAMDSGEATAIRAFFSSLSFLLATFSTVFSATTEGLHEGANVLLG